MWAIKRLPETAKARPVSANGGPVFFRGGEEGIPFNQNSCYYMSRFIKAGGVRVVRLILSGPVLATCRGWSLRSKIFIESFGAKNFFVRFCSRPYQNEFQGILRILSKFYFREFFFIFLESSETYADPTLNENGAKLNFSSKFFVADPETLNENFVK